MLTIARTLVECPSSPTPQSCIQMPCNTTIVTRNHEQHQLVGKLEDLGTFFFATFASSSSRGFSSFLIPYLLLASGFKHPWTMLLAQQLCSDLQWGPSQLRLHLLCFFLCNKIFRNPSCIQELMCIHHQETNLKTLTKIVLVLPVWERDYAVSLKILIANTNEPT